MQESVTNPTSPAGSAEHTVRAVVSDAEQARTAFESIRSNRYNSSKVRAAIRGFRDGEAPFSEEQQARMTRQQQTNLNFGEYATVLMANEDVFFDMLFGRDGFVDIAVPTTDGLSPILARSYEERLTAAFNNAMNAWKGHAQVRLTNIQEMVAVGGGPILFRDRLDWIPTPLSFNSLFVPLTAPPNVEEWTLAFVWVPATIHELAAMIDSDKNRESAANEGWNVTELALTLQSASGDVSVGPQGTVDFERIATLAAAGGPFSNDVPQANDLGLVYTYTRNANGKLDLHIFADFGGSSANEWLYTRANWASDWNEIIEPFYLRPSGAMHDGVKGLGHRIYNAMMVKNLSDCRTVDVTDATQNIVIEQQEHSDSEQGPVQIGPYVILPPGAKINSQMLGADVNGGSRVGGQMDRIVAAASPGQQAFRGYMTQSTQPRASREVGFLEGAAKPTLATTANIFDMANSRFYTEIFRRMVKGGTTAADRGHALAAAFREDIKSVPTDVAKKAIVRARPTAGYGSTAYMAAVNSAIKEYVGSMDEVGRRQFVRDTIVGFGGSRLADRYVPALQSDRTPADERTDATLENAMLKGGIALDVLPDQPHASHMVVHDPEISVLISGMMQEKIPLEQGFPGLAALLDHQARHIDFATSDPTLRGIRDAMLNNLKSAVKMRDAFAQQLGKMKQARENAAREQQALAEQAAEQQRQSEVERALLDFAQEQGVDLEKARLKVAALAQAKRERTMVDAQLEREKMQVDAQLERERMNQGDTRGGTEGR